MRKKSVFIVSTEISKLKLKVCKKLKIDTGLWKVSNMSSKKLEFISTKISFFFWYAIQMKFSRKTQLTENIIWTHIEMAWSIWLKKTSFLLVKNLNLSLQKTPFFEYEKYDKFLIRPSYSTRNFGRRRCVVVHNFRCKLCRLWTKLLVRLLPLTCSIVCHDQELTEGNDATMHRYKID